jgi:hypothetical protein
MTITLVSGTIREILLKHRVSKQFAPFLLSFYTDEIHDKRLMNQLIKMLSSSCLKVHGILCIQKGKEVCKENVLISKLFYSY